jgi:hypothetical protein
MGLSPAPSSGAQMEASKMSNPGRDPLKNEAQGSGNFERFGSHRWLIGIEALMLVGIVGILAAFVYEAIHISDREALARAPLEIPGFIEAEDLRIVGKSGDFNALRQDTASFPGRWSERDHLFVSTKSEGQSVSLELPHAESGEYLLQVYLTKSWDYGIVQLYLNDEKLGSPIDLWSPGIESTGPLSLGKVVLKGDHDVVRLEVTGHNEAASQPFMQFGIDGFVLKRNGASPR